MQMPGGSPTYDPRPARQEAKGSAEGGAQAWETHHGPNAEALCPFQIAPLDFALAFMRRVTAWRRWRSGTR
jgi:hypothetical protein